MDKIIRILIVAATLYISTAVAYGYTDDDGIVFKGQWFKRYVLVPEKYPTEDNKRIIVSNDDLIIKVNRDGIITKLIFDVHNNTKQTISFTINRAYLRIGNNVYPLRSRGQTQKNDVWEVAKMNKKKKYSRRYVETAQPVPLNLNTPEKGAFVIPYKINGVTKIIEIEFVIAPCENVNDENEDDNVS